MCRYFNYTIRQFECMLHDLLLLLFLLPMIPLYTSYLSGFTVGKLVLTNNCFNAVRVVIRYFICFLPILWLFSSN